MKTAQTLSRRIYRRLAPPLMVSVVYFGVLVYPVLRALMLAFPGWHPGTLILLVIMVGPLAGRLAYELRPGAMTRILSALTLTWLGCSFVLFSLVAPWELANLALALPARSSGVLLLGSGAVLSLYALINAQRIRVRALQLAMPRLSRPMRVAQISDVHIGSRRSGFLDRVVARVNDQRPDITLITGDLIDFAGISETALAGLGRIASPAYFIIGNHERYVDTDAIVARLQSLGVNVLRDAALRVGELQLVGIDDAESKRQIELVLRTISPDPEACRLVLYHRPDGCEAAAAWGADLMLTGHTHNGQIVPFNYVVKRVFPRIHGLYTVGRCKLYVSPGTGTWGPVMRLGSRNEITLFNLHPDPEPG